MRTKDEAKEQLILDTALQLIARSGLTGLKMSDLAREAGVATGTLYIYVDDKTALVHKLYTYLLRKTVVDLPLGIVSTDPLRVKLQKIARNYLNNCIEHPEYEAFFEQYLRSPYAQQIEAVQTEENALLQPVYELVIQGQQETIIKEAPADMLVTMVCGMLSALGKEAYYTQQPLTETAWQMAFSVIWDGIKR